MNALIFAATGASMGRAWANTFMGICIVFVMLLLISFVISLLKVVNKIGKKEEPKAAPAPVQEAAVQEAAPETDDLELIAVITAAIEAYEAEQGNAVDPSTLVVRSIKKRNTGNWKKA